MRSRCGRDTPCDDPELRATDHYDEGLTGLAVLCFLGAGFTHESKEVITDSALEHGSTMGDVVLSALRWLRKNQNPDGSFGKHRPFMYTEALATMAMSEAFAHTQNHYFGEPAQKGIDFLQHAQRLNPSGRGLWGWRYASRMEIEETPRTFRGDAFDSDTSITAWCVMALRSGEAAGLRVERKSLDGARAFCEFVTADNGLVGYLDAKSAGATVTGPFDDRFTYHPTTMSALGMSIRLFTREDLEDPTFDLAAKRLMDDRPHVTQDRASVDYYNWQFGTLVIHHFDGPESPARSGKYWIPWQKAVREAVLSLQDQKVDACSKGGWLVSDRWGSYSGCGPIYNTAMSLLILEICSQR
jgi:hypothetical protein